MDKYDNAPSGCDPSVWERFVSVRRSKIKMEDTLRIKDLNYNEMELYLDKRKKQDDNKRREIEEYSKNSLA